MEGGMVISGIGGMVISGIGGMVISGRWYGNQW